MATKTKKRSVGRPEGAKSADYDVVPAVRTQCKKCQSYDRTPYRIDGDRTLRREFDGMVVLTIWRRTSCRKCGQHRFDVFTEREELPR